MYCYRSSTNGVFRVTSFFVALQLAGCVTESLQEHNDQDNGVALTAAEQISRNQEVQEYLDRRRSRWEIVDTRATESGQVVDYVTIESLYPNSPKAPYAEPPRKAELEQGERSLRGFTEPEQDESLRAPEGTIPVPRPDFSAYINGEHAARTLQEFIEGFGKPTPNVSNDRLYGAHRDARSNIGTHAMVNLWRYDGVEATNQFSLLQLSSECGSGNGFEAIEAGYIVNRQRYGNNSLHMFTFFRTAGGSVGDRIGGWDEDQDGFIRAAGVTTWPGAVVSTTSAWDASQYDCHLETELFQGNWWVYSCGTWLGYYPTQNSTSVDPSDRISFDLIASSACRTQWFGEVWDSSETDWTNANMGGGGFAWQGWARAGYIREPQVQLNATTWDWMANNDLSGAGFDDDCYTADAIQSNGGAGWTRWFYVGGPGGDGAGCD